MKKMGGRDYQLWDEEDGFFYDVLRYPDGTFHKFRVRSLVGLIPLYAIDVAGRGRRSNACRCSSTDVRLVHPQPAGSRRRRRASRSARTARAATCCRSSIGISSRAAAARVGPGRVPVAGRHPQPVEVPRRSSRSLRRQRSAIRAGRSGRQDQGRQLELARADLVPDVVPADRGARESSTTRIRIGASRCTAPGSHGTPITPRDMAKRDRQPDDRALHPRRGRPPADLRRRRRSSRQDPHWRDCLLFNEYFHGDNGAGLGANHQTGWTGAGGEPDRRVAPMSGTAGARHYAAAPPCCTAARSSSPRLRDD